MSRQVGSKRQNYSDELFEHAVGLVRAKSISLNQAAKKYGVPKTTLQNAVHNRYSSHKVGHKTVLTENEEKRIADWAIHMARIGYGRTRQELALTVKKILDDDGRITPFRDNKPGKEWLNRFFTRHPDLSLRTTIQLGKERAIISPDKIAKWFADFKTYIEEEVGDKDLLQDSTRIYNADETGISLCMKGNRVIGFKGAPVVYHYGNSDKTQLTVMAACSVSAHFVPPMIIFPGQHFSFDPLEGFEEAALGRSGNGWMDKEDFCKWLENVFIPSVNARNVKKPVLLLLDGHVTHISMKASDICLQNGIEMYCLLEHASHVLQPLDLRLFSSLKKAWRQAVRDWQAEHIGEYVTKINFARVFRTAWVQSTTVDVAVKGFKEAGLFPLDPSIVEQSIKIEPSKIFDLSATCKTEIKNEEKKGTEQGKLEKTATVLETRKCDERSAMPTFSGDTHTVMMSGETSKSSTEQVNNETKTESNETRTVTSTCQASVVSSATSREPPLIESSTTTAKLSPFSKHLSIPTPKLTKPKAAKRIPIPKAITGTEYRKLMEEKRLQKEEEQREKERKKQERLEKRKIKEEERKKRKADAEAKREKRSQEKKRKQLRKQLLRSFVNSYSEFDGAMPMDKTKCYACDQPYATDFMECSNCFRRFHISCADDEYMQSQEIDIPYECKFC